MVFVIEIWWGCSGLKTVHALCANQFQRPILRGFSKLQVYATALGCNNKQTVLIQATQVANTQQLHQVANNMMDMVRERQVVSMAKKCCLDAQQRRTSRLAHDQQLQQLGVDKGGKPRTFFQSFESVSTGRSCRIN